MYIKKHNERDTQLSEHSVTPSVTPRDTVTGVTPLMDLTITMDNPDQVIMRELDPAKRGITQASVAVTYACLIAQGSDADWPKINAAIVARWKGETALIRIQRMAWKQVDDWHRRGQPGAAL